jgi:hypothetical protein
MDVRIEDALGNNLKTRRRKYLREVVRPVRFELTTFCSGGKRSIQTELRAQETS